MGSVRLCKCACHGARLLQESALPERARGRCGPGPGPASGQPEWSEGSLAAATRIREVLRHDHCCANRQRFAPLAIPKCYLNPTLLGFSRGLLYAQTQRLQAIAGLPQGHEGTERNHGPCAEPADRRDGGSLSKIHPIQAVSESTRSSSEEERY